MSAIDTQVTTPPPPVLSQTALVVVPSYAGGGRTTPVELYVAQDDALLRTALRPYISGVDTAQIQREVVEDRLVVTIITRLETKGFRPLVEALEAAPEFQHPVLLMHERVSKLERDGDLTARWLVLLHGEISDSIERGNEHDRRVTNMLGRLLSAAPVPAETVPEGF